MGNRMERIRSGIERALDYFAWLLAEHPTTILVIMALYAALVKEDDALTIIFLLAGILNELVMIRGSIDGR